MIGNGSSLRTQNLQLLKKELIFTMNAFHRHPLCETRQPDYHFLADPLYFDGSSASDEFIRDLAKSCCGTVLFVPLSSAAAAHRLCQGTAVTVCGVPFVGNLASYRCQAVDFTRGIPGCQSVSQFAIIAAMYMGCSPIILLGMDHDWATHRGPDRHFYVGKTLGAHPGELASLADSSYLADLEAMAALWRGYEVLKQWAGDRGVEIRNATNGGFLDVFDRTTLENALRQ